MLCPFTRGIGWHVRAHLPRNILSKLLLLLWRILFLGLHSIIFIWCKHFACVNIILLTALIHNLFATYIFTNLFCGFIFCHWISILRMLISRVYLIKLILRFGGIGNLRYNSNRLYKLIFARLFLKLLLVYKRINFIFLH